MLGRPLDFELRKLREGRDAGLIPPHQPVIRFPAFLKPFRVQPFQRAVVWGVGKSLRQEIVFFRKPLPDIEYPREGNPPIDDLPEIPVGQGPAGDTRDRNRIATYRKG